MTGRAKNTKNFKKFDGRIETITLMPHNLVFGSTPEMTVFFGGSRTLWRGPRVTGRAKNTKKFKNFDGRIETILLMPHNLVFDSRNDCFLGGPGVTGRAKNTKKIDRRIETISLMPHDLVFGSTPEITVFYGVTG